MQNIVINFTGDTAALQNIIDALDQIVKKNGDIGLTWKQTSEQIESASKKNAASTIGLTKNFEGVTTAVKNIDKAIIGAAASGTFKKLSDQIAQWSAMGVQGAKLIQQEIDNLIKKENVLAVAIKSTSDPKTSEQLQTGLKQTQDQVLLLTNALQGLKQTGEVFKPLISSEGEVSSQTTTLINELGKLESINFGDLKISAAGLIDARVAAQKLTNTLKELGTSSAPGFADLKSQGDQLITKFNKIKSILEGGPLSPKIAQELNKELLLTGNKIQLVQDQLGKYNKGQDNAAAHTQNFTTELRSLRNQIESIQLAIKDGTSTTAQVEQLDILTSKYTNLARVQKQFQIETKGLVANDETLAGTISLVRGVAGGYAVAQGAAALFGTSNEAVAQTLLKVNAAMAILQGLSELTATIQKSSAGSIFLESIFRKKNVDSLLLQKTTQEGVNLVNKEGIVIDEAAGLEKKALTGANIELAAGEDAAKIATQGLSASMLLSPVGLVLLGILALVGAYEVYINTIGKANEIQKKINDDIDAANQKAAESIAKEQSSLETLLITVKSEVTTREQKVAALNEITAKYPEYLSKLTLENVLTKDGADLIEKQIELIKRKATVAALEDLYTESLKKQLKAQVEISRLEDGGNLTALQRAKAILQQLSGVGAAGATQSEIIISGLKDEVKDLGIETEGVFSKLNESSDKVSELFIKPGDNLRNLSSEVGFFLTQAKSFTEAIDGLKNQKPVSPKLTPDAPAFDPTTFDSEKAIALKIAQNRVDVAKKGSQEEFAARRALAEKEHELDLEDARRTDANKLRLESEGKYISAIETLDTEARARAYKAQKDAADANVISVEAAGKKESDSYFNARIIAIKAAAAEQINQERFHADAIRKINEQLNLDLIQNEIARGQSRFEKEKELIDARLILAQKGSEDEFNSKIAFIKIEEQEELNQLGITEQKRAEIQAKFQKQRQDAEKAFRESQLQDEISIDNAGLERFGLTEKEKLPLVIERLNDQEKLEIISAEKNTSKITEIKARFDAQRLQAEKTAIEAQLALELRSLDVYGQKAKLTNELILNNSNSSPNSRITANNELQIAESIRIDKERAALEVENTIVVNGVKLLSYKDYYERLRALQNEQDAINQTHAENELQIFRDLQDKKLAALNVAVSILQKGLDNLDTGGLKTGLKEIVGLFSQIGAGIAKNKEAQKAIGLEDDPAKKRALQEIADGTKEENRRKLITAGIEATQATINQLFADSSARRQEEVNAAISALEDQKKHELDNKKLTSEQIADIDKKYRDKERQVKTQAFQADKEARKIQAVINGALAITNILATAPAPSWPFLIPAAIATTLIEVAVIGAAKVPKFAKGEVDINTWNNQYTSNNSNVSNIRNGNSSIRNNSSTSNYYKNYSSQVDITGPGTKTSDSIPAMISVHESVINADATLKWKDALKAINENKFEGYLHNKFAEFSFPKIPDFGHSSTTINNFSGVDYDKLGKALAENIKVPAPTIIHTNPVTIENNIDDEGLKRFITKGNSKTEHKNRRYNMRS